MSCRSALAAAAVVLALAGCAGHPAPAADATTAKLAAAEAAHLCDVRAANARTEGELKAGLVRHLRGAGLDEAAWRRWHDSLRRSPARAAQLAAATAAPCL